MKIMRICGRIGQGLIAFARRYALLFGMLLQVVWMVFQPKTWVYPVRNRLARQILFAGVYAVPITLLVAILVGLTFYFQTLFWLEYTGRIEPVGRIVGIVLLREAAPVMATFIVIGASAAAMTTELANMKTSGEVALLESQGIDLFHFLAVPRITALSICTLGLGILFVATALLVMSLCFLTMGASGGAHAVPFLQTVFANLNAGDLAALLSKSALPGLMVGAICCYEGLKVKGALTEVPVAVTLSILRSITFTAMLYAVVMVFTYLL